MAAGAEDVATLVSHIRDSGTQDLFVMSHGWGNSDEVADQFYRGMFAQEMADWPEDVRELLIDRHVSPEWLRTGLQEASNVNQLYDEVRHAGPMPDVPMIVLCSMSTDAFKEAVSVGESESLLREEIEGKRRLYTALAASVPRGEIRLIDAGHVTMHLRHPDAVLQAVQDLLIRFGN